MRAGSADAQAPDVESPLARTRVLRTEVLAALRGAILTGRIPIGSRLLETEISGRLGVSRAPVREAIRQLEQEGLVESFAHRGAIVIGLPEDEIDALYELRAVLEAKAIARVCEVATEEDLQALDGLVDEMQAALTDNDLGRIAEVDLRFHGLIVELSGFTLLRRIWSSLDGLVRVRSVQALERPTRAAEHFIRDSVASHTRLTEAVRLRDPELAGKRASEHVLEVPNRLRSDGHIAPDAGGEGTPGGGPAQSGEGRKERGADD